MTLRLHPNTGKIIKKACAYFSLEKLADANSRQNIRNAVYTLVSRDGTNRPLAQKLASVVISSAGCGRMCDEKIELIEEAVCKLATVGEVDTVLAGIADDDVETRKMASSLRHLNWEYGMKVLSELGNV